MVGKPPHRPAGKARTDNEHMAPVWEAGGMPYAEGLSAKEQRDESLRAMGEREPPTVPAEPEVGGSRPGVESRVREAIDRRESREAADEGER